MLGQVVNLSGPPGAGKTTVGPLLADFAESSVHIDGDLLMLSIRRGFVAPWLDWAGEQNRTVITAIANAAATFAGAGYFVVVDLLVGPWILDVFRAPLVAADIPVHYVVLRPKLELALQRAQSRTGNALTAEGPIRQMWHRSRTSVPTRGTSSIQASCRPMTLPNSYGAGPGKVSSC